MLIIMVLISWLLTIPVNCDALVLTVTKEDHAFSSLSQALESIDVGGRR